VFTFPIDNFWLPAFLATENTGLSGAHQMIWLKVPWGPSAPLCAILKPHHTAGLGRKKRLIFRMELIAGKATSADDVA